MQQLLHSSLDPILPWVNRSSFLPLSFYSSLFSVILLECAYFLFTILKFHTKWSECGKSLQRSVLHIRSQSNWAPLCIGPYSQAQLLYKELILLSGQIPLEPSTMLTIETDGDMTKQLDQCLRNICRTLVPLRSTISRALFLIVYIDKRHCSANRLELVSHLRALMLQEMRTKKYVEVSSVLYQHDIFVTKYVTFKTFIS